MFEGKVTDYGDLLHIERWVVKGKRVLFYWHIGAPKDTRPEDRKTTNQKAALESTGKVDITMDLMADKKVTLGGKWADEMQNPVPAPEGATVTYTVDNTDVIALTDNQDGTAVAAATGTLGQAVVHAEANVPGRAAMTSDLLIVVVAGDAERFEMQAGEPEEVTPDGGTEEPAPTE